MRHIYLTVDTECHDYNKRNQYIDGHVGDECWGIKKILDLAEEFKIPVNFFVDVGEEKVYGSEFVKEIVDLIHSYNQPVFFHLHPDYITGDKDRSFLWQYSKEEKKKILEEAYGIYKKYAVESDRLIFRAGRYGIDEELVDELKTLGPDVLDLSYIYSGKKMCHLSYEDIGVKNALTKIDNVVIFPTTRFVGFRYFGRVKCIGLDAADATFNEYKRVISKTELTNVVWTMHSWNFIRKWFFLSNYIQKDVAMEKKFRKSIRVAKNNGFVFSDLRNLDYVSESDELIDLCEGFSGKLLGIINNFVRFQKIARLNKKYLMLYAGFYICMLICFIILIFNILC